MFSFHRRNAAVVSPKYEHALQSSIEGAFSILPVTYVSVAQQSPTKHSLRPDTHFYARTELCRGSCSSQILVHDKTQLSSL